LHQISWRHQVSTTANCEPRGRYPCRESAHARTQWRQRESFAIGSFVKTFSVDLSQRAGTTVGFQVFAAHTGTVTVNPINGPTGQSILATGIAISKRGGW
jgi:hypothetical protein